MTAERMCSNNRNRTVSQTGEARITLPKVESIVRTDDPSRADWEPLPTTQGFQLVSRAIPYPARNRTSSATFVDTLEKAWDLIHNHDYGIRMAPPGAKRGNYIYRKDLKAT
jgi:hypothetical protein